MRCEFQYAVGMRGEKFVQTLVDRGLELGKGGV